MVTELAKPEFTCLADKNSAPLPENIVIHPRRVISSVLRRVSLTRFTIISRSPSLPASSPLPIPFLLLSFSRFSPPVSVYFSFSIRSVLDVRRRCATRYPSRRSMWFKRSVEIVFSESISARYYLDSRELKSNDFFLSRSKLHYL